MKVKINQYHINNDTDQKPAIVAALQDALGEQYIVGMIHGNPTIKTKDGYISNVIQLTGEAKKFEEACLRKEKVSPCEVEIDLKKLARNPK